MENLIVAIGLLMLIPVIVANLFLSRYTRSRISAEIVSLIFRAIKKILKL